MDEPKWYAAYTKPRNEKKVFQFLSEKGIQTYVPLQKRLKQWSDRRKWVEEPLLNSYIFVHIPLSQYYDVLNTPGVVRYVTFEGKAVPIPENQIEVLRRLVASESEIEVSPEKFREGDKVEVRTGPLFGLSGELVEFRGKRLVLMRIDQIGQSLLVNIPLAFLEPAGKRP
jgi:transcriptional antiterminator RfaH